MNVFGIIKDAFLFPSRNTGRFAIYLLLSVLMVGFILGGVFTNILGVVDSQNFLLGGFYYLIAILIGFMIAGYHLKVIKSGIELDDEVPVFENLFEIFMTGFDYIVVLIAYFIIPSLIVLVVGYGTNLFDNATTFCQESVMQLFNVYFMGIPADVAFNAIFYEFVNFADSLAITIAVAIVLFAIFSIIQSFAQARLAKTGSLREALNIFESLKDITRIGLGKSILVILLVVLIVVVIELILITLFNYHPFLVSIIYIILNPYIVLFTQRAFGLLYSDIA